MTAQPPTEAIVFVLSKHLLPNAAICIEYCVRSGYNMVGVVRDDWTEAMRMVHSGTADVIVVADERDMAPDRTPRVEIISHQNARSAGPAAVQPARRRTSRITRPDAAA